MFSTTTIQALLRSNTADMARRRHALIGKPAPDISLPNYNGEVFELKPSSEGVPIVLFFYPKSGTYTSTKEACELRDAIIGKETLFKATKVKVVGISPDPVEIQKEFVEKQRLPYPVLSDVKGDARKAYQTGKGLLGLTYARVTFIIDSKGILRDSLDATLNYGAHVKFVNKWLEQLDEQAKRSDGEATAVNTPTEYATTAPKEEPAAADVAQVILELAGKSTTGTGA